MGITDDWACDKVPLGMEVRPSPSSTFHHLNPEQFRSKWPLGWVPRRGPGCDTPRVSSLCSGLWDLTPGSRVHLSLSNLLVRGSPGRLLNCGSLELWTGPPRVDLRAAAHVTLSETGAPVPQWAQQLWKSGMGEAYEGPGVNRRPAPASCLDYPLSPSQQ